MEDNKISKAMLNDDSNSKNNYESPIGFENKKRRTPTQIEEIWKNLRKIPEVSKCIYILLIIAAVSSLAIMIIGIVLHVRIASTMSKLLIAFGTISLVTFLYGIFSIYHRKIFIQPSKSLSINTNKIFFFF